MNAWSRQVVLFLHLIYIDFSNVCFSFAQQLDENTEANVGVSHSRVHDLHVLFVDPFKYVKYIHVKV